MEEQIIGALKEREAGAKTADLGFPIDSEGLDCTPSLDRPRVEFSGLIHGDGLAASPGFSNEIGGLLPIAPCGRSSL